ncbi:Remorin family protein [Rhynchospora pubera]|uniref:Remorin family protein n=1 Tax=Rhynchospora pubera TaxID=906938 RepID=A0AAV8FXX0_9POAL|nr:Remorin family protein [Rhynchospora pubera]
MNNMGEYAGGTFEAAVAAAAFAAMASENDLSSKQKDLRKESSMKKPADAGGKFVRWLSNRDAKEDTKPSGESTFTRSTTTTPDRPTTDQKAPSFKKTPTFSEEIRDRAGTRKTLSFSEEGRGRNGSKKTPTFLEDNRERGGSKRFDRLKEQEIQPAPGWDKLGPRSTILGPQPGETKVDVWEREQMEKIRERFEKMNITILEWENEKKVKAKQKLERKEREIETRRLKAQAAYREEMSRIDKIVGGARTLAEERKRNDEIKAIEKAKKMRSVEQSPKSSCPCF